MRTLTDEEIAKLPPVPEGFSRPVEGPLDHLETTRACTVVKHSHGLHWDDNDGDGYAGAMHATYSLRLDSEVARLNNAVPPTPAPQPHLINMDKQYRTHDGREVKLFTTEARNNSYPVVGEVLSKGQWRFATWSITGAYLGGKLRDTDLVEYIEPVPLWSKELWVHSEGRFTVQDMSHNSNWRKIQVTEVRPTEID